MQVRGFEVLQGVEWTDVQVRGFKVQGCGRSGGHGGDWPKLGAGALRSCAVGGVKGKGRKQSLAVPLGAPGGNGRFRARVSRLVTRSSYPFLPCFVSSSVWFGLVWFGLVWFGLVWFGLVWFDLVWFGLIVIMSRQHLRHEVVVWGWDLGLFE